MKHRKLRIAWSVASGALCLLMIVFWVRSYWIADAWGRGSFGPDTTTLTAILSSRGVVILEQRTAITSLAPFRGLTDGWEHHTTAPAASVSRFIFEKTDGHMAIGFPIWLPGILFLIMGWV